MKIPIAFLLLVFALAAQAAEYKVVLLEGLKRVEKQDGYHVDRQKTEALNKLASEGWKVIAVTGATGADHVVYLCRDDSQKPDC